MSKAMIEIKDLEAHMAWVKLPSKPQRSITELWQKLHDETWFARMIAGDRPDRIGVRVLGGGGGSGPRLQDQESGSCLAFR